MSICNWLENGYYLHFIEDNNYYSIQSNLHFHNEYFDDAYLYDEYFDNELRYDLRDFLKKTLINKSSNKTLILNIYNYLRIHFTDISTIITNNNFNHWVKYNFYGFMKKYYIDIYDIIVNSIKYFHSIKIFSIYFYQKCKRYFLEKYSTIIETKIQYNINYENNFEIIRVNDYVIKDNTIDNTIYNSTLQKLCLDKIEYIQYSYRNIVKKDNFIDENLMFKEENLNDYIDKINCYIQICEFYDFLNQHQQNKIILENYVKNIDIYQEIYENWNELYL
jgi:hypothetical protein